MCSLPELVLYSALNFIPYVFLAIYPLRDRLRFPLRVNVVTILVGTAAQVGFTAMGLYTHSVYAEMLSYLSNLFFLVLYFVSIRANPGRKLFNLLMILNVANFVVVGSKCMENAVFPEYVYDYYRWSYSLCMVVIELAVLIPFFMYLRYFSSQARGNSEDSPVWRFVWLVPALFYLLWYFIYYHSETISSLELAISGSKTLFSLVILLGQYIIYACIAKLVGYNAKVLELEQDAHYLSLQTIQYKNIQTHIQEVRTMRHDLRHHISVLRTYSDEKNFEALTDYLDSLAQRVESSGPIHYCSNPILNMILVYFGDLCHAEGFSLEVTLAIPETIPLSDREITVLFGNLLENAEDACRDCAKPAITVLGKLQQNQLVFILENTYENAISRNADGSFATTKEGGSGIGTQSARRIVEDHGGFIDFSPEDGLFSVSILLPLPSSED